MQALDDMLETIYVNGVAILVDKGADCAYVHTVGLCRTLLSPINEHNIELGNWLSLTITENKNTFLSYEKTRCRYAAVGKARSIDEVVPTGVRFEKGSGPMICVRVGANIGAVREAGAIALSQHIGRIFVNHKLCESMNLKSLICVEIEAQIVKSCEVNAECFWMAKNAATIEDDSKLNQGIRKCNGRFSGFIQKNICLLQLFGHDAGFVCLRPSDFHLPISLKKLREAKAIEVYANLAVSTQKKFLIPACYARLLEEDELKTLSLDETDAAPKEVNITAVGKQNTELNAAAVAETVAPFQDKLENKLECNHAELLRRLIAMGHIAMELHKRNLDLY